MKKAITAILLFFFIANSWAQCIPPSIFTEPTSYSGACDGVNFFCFANGDNLVYQWQMNDGGGFVNLTNVAPFSNTSGEVLDIYQPPYSLDGNLFRCVVTGSCGPNDTSNVVSLGVVPPVVIQVNAAPQTTCEGNSAVFSIQTTGVFFQNWEEASSPLGPWNPLSDGGVYSGVNTNTLTITGVTAGMNGNYYRCAMQTVCFGSGDVYSDTVLLTVTAPGSCNPLNVWLGSTNQWISNSNWSLGAFPNSCSTDVLIPTSPIGGNMPVVGPVVPQIGNITIQSGASLTVGVAVTVCGNVSGGIMTSGKFLGNGTVVLQGTSLQQLNGKLDFRKIRLNSSVGAILQNGAVVTIDSFIALQSGVLNTNNGSFTLKSNPSTTAYVNNFSPNTYSGSINGPITVERYIGNSADGYRNLSSPVSTQVADLADDFSVFGQNGVQCWYTYTPYPNVQVYNEALSIVNGNYYEGWLSYTGSGNTLNAMKGIAARTYAGAPFTIDFTGTPYDGNQSIGITQTTSSTPSQDGWNLIGNPYPSPIKWSLVKALNAGETDGSYYAFHTTGEYSGNWGSHNGTTGVNGATDEIAIGQGFFVLASGNQTFNMDNSVRSTLAANYYKTDAVNNEVRLTLSNGVNSDEIVAYTDVNATVGYDAGYDAVKMPAGSTVYISYNMPGKEYAINVLDEINEQTELPLLLWVKETGVYTLSANALNVDGMTAYLRDAETNVLTNLSTNNASISLNGEQVYTDRYSVVFKINQPSSVQEVSEPVKIYAHGNTVYVNRATTEIATISITNVLGQQISEFTTANMNSVIKLSNTDLMYVIVKVTEGNRVSVAKELITNK